MPNIGELSLYDVVGTPGVAADVSHMDSMPKVSDLDEQVVPRSVNSFVYLIGCKNTQVCGNQCKLVQVTSHLGPDQLSNALYNSHLVIIPAGVPRKPGMTRDDLFNINAGKSHMKFACTRSHNALILCWHHATC